MKAISIDHLWKEYRLGVIDHGTLHKDLQSWWARVRGREDPNSKVSLVFSHTQPERSFGDRFWALQDISLEVNQGDLVGIIGRNGAGKSTLLKILSRVTAPTRGEITVEGRIASMLEVGTGFHPELTGRENIFLNGAILGMSKADIKGKLDEIIDFSGIEQFIDTPVKRYSSGMYVRLAFAVAAHLDPEILVVDEVLAVGDLAFQKKCLSKMEAVGHEGRTVLFVSHNMPAIVRLCHKAVLLDEGRMICGGTSADVVSSYLSRASETRESRSWEIDQAPGTREIQLLGVTVMKKDGSPITVATVADELAVRLTYHVNVPNLSFRCLVAFCSAGVIVFAALEPSETVREDVGTYHSTVIIPPNLLAENEYVLNVSIFTSRGVKMHYVQIKDVIAFQVIDRMEGNSARGDYAEGYLGLIRPLLKWNISQKPADQ